MRNNVIQGFFPNGQARLGAPGMHSAPPHPGGQPLTLDPRSLGLANGGGQPLPHAVRSRMEAAFGTDFSAVRVHVGPRAERIGAHAFTTGTDIYFAPGRYQPESAGGQQLLAHELSHVVQQRQGRVRAAGMGGAVVVQDRVLDMEAERLGQRAVAQAKPFAGAVQRSPVQTGVNPARLVSPRQGPPVLQAKGGKKLKELATPKIFPGPEVQVQSQLVDLLEANDQLQWPLMCLGAVLLPEVLPGDKEQLIAACKLISAPNPAALNKYSAIEDDDLVKGLIVRNTISTMVTAGQIEYLRASGLTTGDWRIVVEVHYYRDRPKNQLGFHKDTLGQTLFVNLNFVTSHAISGPEYILNPNAVAAHDANTKGSLPKPFRKHVKRARQTLRDEQGKPTEIGETTIPANGVIAFVDELIHHSTPLYGHRTVPGAVLGQFLAEKYPAKYNAAEEAWEAYQKTTYGWGFASTIGSWTGSFFSKDLNDSRNWYYLIGMTKQAQTQFGRPQLMAVGMSKQDIDELMARYDPSGTGRFPFEKVSIPKVTGTSQIQSPGKPRLERRMSDLALKKKLPKQVTGERRFFRTWVRAVPA